MDSYSPTFLYVDGTDITPVNWSWDQLMIHFYPKNYSEDCADAGWFSSQICTVVTPSDFKQRLYDAAKAPVIYKEDSADTQDIGYDSLTRIRVKTSIPQYPLVELTWVSDLYGYSVAASKDTSWAWVPDIFLFDDKNLGPRLTKLLPTTDDEFNGYVNKDITPLLSEKNYGPNEKKELQMLIDMLNSIHYTK